MTQSPETTAFIFRHINDDTDKLLLSASGFPNVDVPFAVNQILIRRQLKEKLSAWSENRQLVFPSRISAEQCSSHHTATYKQQLIRGNSVCDMTGGLGVDAWYFSRKAKQVVYVEQNGDYCACAEANFRELGAGNIRVIHADSTQVADQLQADTFYLDPARRSRSNKRLFALSDCEPDVLLLKAPLLRKAARLIVKLSPMADVDETIRLLPETSEVHVLAVRNECKEILFVLENETAPRSAIPIYTVNYLSDHSAQHFVFDRKAEKQASGCCSGCIKEYLYEPNAAILKAGAFKSVVVALGVDKIERHSHLYTSDRLLPHFPGRAFVTVNVFDFSAKGLIALAKAYPKANITTRNFPLSVAEIRRRTKIGEGGGDYLFASTISGNKRVIIACKKPPALQPGY